MRTETMQDYQERVLRVLVHIQHHLDDELPLEELARLAHFSPFHFHRIFRGMVGEGVSEHVRRLRLQRAAMWLRHTRRQIVRIALESGFESHEAFLRAFRALYGVVPSQYRRLNGAAPSGAGEAGIAYDPEHVAERFKPIHTGAETMNVEVKEMPALRIAFIRHTGPYNSQGIYEAWRRLMQWGWSRGAVGPETRCLGICHDDPDVTPPEKCRYDACLTVGPGVAGEGEIGIAATVPGLYAMAVHQGPYEEMGPLYARMCGEWLPAHGYEMRAAPLFEVYVNFPGQVQPAELLTELYFPIERASGV